jgi:hypothetical protein
MNSDTKENLTKQSTWKRIAYMVMFVITFNVAEMVLFVVVVLQVAFKLLTGRPLDPLKELGQEIGVYLRSIVNFLTFNSEDMPFPVSAWPGGVSSDGSNSNSGDDQPENGGPVSTRA